MDQDQVIAGLCGLKLDGVAAVVAAGIALIGQHAEEHEATAAFESAVRSHGGSNEDMQADLKAGGAAIYHAVNDLDDGDFDFDEQADEADDE